MMTPDPSTNPALLDLLGVIADALTQIARNTQREAPEAPDYQRPLDAYPGFDWSTIEAAVVANDRHGPTLIEWSGQLWKRRSPENKFGAAIWYSRAAGKDEAGNNHYLRLITFRPIGDVEPLSRAAEAAVTIVPPPAALAPSAPSTSAPPVADSATEFNALPSAAEQLARTSTLLATDASGEIWRTAPELACPNCGRAYQHDNADCPKHHAGIGGSVKRQASLAGGAAGGEFRNWANQFSKTYPRYRLHDDSGPDLYHITMTAAALGITEITAGNLAYVKARLTDHATLDS